MTRIASHIILLVYDKAHLCRLISNLKLPSQTTVLIFLLLVKESLDDFQQHPNPLFLRNRKTWDEYCHKVQRYSASEPQNQPQ